MDIPIILAAAQMVLLGKSRVLVLFLPTTQRNYSAAEGSQGLLGCVVVMLVLVYVSLYPSLPVVPQHLCNLLYLPYLTTQTSRSNVDNQSNLGDSQIHLGDNSFDTTDLFASSSFVKFDSRDLHLLFLQPHADNMGHFVSTPFSYFMGYLL